jgi:membrane protein
MESLLHFRWKIFFHKLYEKFFAVDVSSRSAQVAFYFAFAFFPLLFFLVSLFGLLLDSTEGLQNELFQYLRQIMPSTVFVLVRKTVEEVIENSTGGKLTLGLLITLWSASAGIDSIRTALNEVYGLKETRSWFNTKFQSLVLTLLIIILVGAGLAIVFYGWRLVGIALAAMNLQVTSPWVLITIQWVSFFIVMLLAVEMVFSWVPNYGKFRWIWITPGSLVAMVLWLLLTTGFRIYLQYFNSYNKTYGSLGAVIILMLWLYLTAMVVLIGGAINSVLSDMHKEDADAKKDEGENESNEKPDRKDTAE